jgi:DNA-binding response OmpR family regulator
LNQSILIADDDPMIRNLLRIMLETAHYNVIEAQDGRDALTKIRATKPDLMILNVMMPKMDGLTVCKTVRQQEETTLLPILMLSGQAHLVAVNRGLLAGANRYITKPMTRGDLLKNLREILDPAPSNNLPL